MAIRQSSAINLTKQLQSYIKDGKVLLVSSDASSTFQNHQESLYSSMTDAFQDSSIDIELIESKPVDSVVAKLT